jgi:lipopolysaccharide transport system permease protein
VSGALSFHLPAYRELILGLIGRDVKTRYKQSVLGYAWAVFYPLATALIFSLVGKVIMRQDTGGLPYPIYAYFGLLYWNLFSSGLTAATESLVSHLNLITKVYFPREVFPIAAVLSKLVDFGFGLVGLVPLLILYRVKPGPLFLVSLVMAGVVVLLTLGWGMLLACANLYFRDVRHLVGIVLSLWGFLVPNIYPLHQVPKEWQGLYLLNPIAALLEAGRRLAFPQTGWMRVIDPAQGNLGSLWPYVGAALVSALLILAVGFVVFKRNEPRFAEYI